MANCQKGAAAGDWHVHSGSVHGACDGACRWLPRRYSIRQSSAYLTPCPRHAVSAHAATCSSMQRADHCTAIAGRVLVSPKPLNNGGTEAAKISHLSTQHSRQSQITAPAGEQAAGQANIKRSEGIALHVVPGRRPMAKPARCHQCMLPNAPAVRTPHQGQGHAQGTPERRHCPKPGQNHLLPIHEHRSCHHAIKSSRGAPKQDAINHGELTGPRGGG